MPKYFIVHCPICGKTKRRPGVKQPHYCSRKCWQIGIRQEISNRIGEPIETAIIRRYILKRMSYREIVAELQINNRTVQRILSDAGVTIRHGSEAIKTQWENNAERRKQFARQTSKRQRAYYANGGTPPSTRPEVARKISKAKKKKNWMKGRVGPKHHLWKGGKIWWRGKEWDDLKEEIRKRDGYRCQHCQMTDEECIVEFGAPLQVHHIIPYRLSKDNSFSNLKTLCNRCHSLADKDFAWVL